MIANLMNEQGYLVGLIAQQRANALQTGTTSDIIVEGSTNLYFTADRARSTVSASSPLSYSSSTGVFSIPVATGSANGYLSSTDWSIFNNKANSFTGYTGTIDVRKGDDSGSLTLTYNNGVLTSVS